MAPPKTTPKDRERAFRFSELFFSTTDKKGVIRYGNRVFSRIAGFSLDEMRGEPHNIIRHPDMPRAAFKLVWDYLERGEPVAAYVKNMARDGCYYWVMALILPTPDGYLSIRIKPSTDYFKTIQGAYKDILEHERAAEAGGGSRKEAIAAGTQRTIELLATLGFKSYDQFMLTALSAEMASLESQSSRKAHAVVDGTAGDAPDHSGPLSSVYRQCKAVEVQLAKLFARLDTFARFGDEVSSQTKFILQLGAEIRLLSINAEVQSARLGESGAALSVVASELGQHSDTGTRTISRLNDRLDQLTPIISRLVFNTLISKLMIGMTTYFLRETLEYTEAGGGVDTTECDHELRENIRLLIRMFLEKTGESARAMDHLQNNLGSVNTEADKLNKFIRLLGVINLAGKVETARTENAQAFNNIFDRVQTQTKKAEAEIAGFLKLIGVNTAQLVSAERLDVNLLTALEASACELIAGRNAA